MTYNTADHIDHIEQWMQIRDMNLELLSELPEYGFIAVEYDLPVAAGFLRMIEGGSAMLDSLITNPAAPSFIRHLAIDALVSRLIALAKALSLSRVIAMTVDDGILRRSSKHGFQPTQQSLITLELGK